MYDVHRSTGKGHHQYVHTILLFPYARVSDNDHNPEFLAGFLVELCTRNEAKKKEDGGRAYADSDLVSSVSDKDQKAFVVDPVPSDIYSSGGGHHTCLIGSSNHISCDSIISGLIIVHTCNCKNDYLLNFGNSSDTHYCAILI